jgi:uncharacterized membrane protein YfcA
VTIALFLALGVAVGLIGTLIGVGGGFIMVPVLVAAYPNATPDQITAISFFTIFANSVSGTVSYARMKRIDYRSGTVFALATLPGSWVGAWLTSRISVGVFEGLLAVMMAIGATLLLVLGGKEGLKKREEKLAAEGHLAQRVPISGLVIGASLSVVVGLVAAMVGIGGGVIHVPAMVFILSFAVHRATATSHFVLAISSCVVTLVHIVHGSLEGYWPVALALACGAVVGAQIGAKLSTRTAPAVIIRGLAVILLLVAGRLAWRTVHR